MSPARGLPRLRIATALIAVFAAVSFVPFVVSHLRLISINREALETAEKQFLTRSAVTLGEATAAYLRTMLVQVRKIADALQLAASISPERDPFAFVGQSRLIVNYRREDPNFLVLRTPNLDGIGGRVEPEGIGEALESELRRGFVSAIRGATFVGDAIRPELFPDGGLVLAVPVRGRGDEVIGVVEAFVSLTPVKGLLVEERKRDLVAYIVDRRGVPVLANDPVLAASRAPLLKTELVAEFVAHPVRLTRSYERKDSSGAHRVLGTVSPIGPAADLPDWGVIVEKDEAKAFASVAQMTRETTLGAALALLLAVIGAVAASKGLSRPVLDLVGKVGQVAKGNFSERVEVRGSRELAQLAETFNLMSAELEKSVEKLKLAAKENQELFLNSIRALAAAVDAKDPYTRGHSERVARYSVVLARHLNLPPEEVRRVRIAALLHDVGKIGIDDRILRKPTALTDEEFEVMKTHPTKGALIMGQIPQLRWIIPGMRHHHEKWDGGGYPEGIAREDIPMLARIISVADTFDAMTTTRPYQKAMPLDYVVSRIRSFSGTRFDPDVIAALDQAFASRELEVVGEAARPAVVAS